MLTADIWLIEGAAMAANTQRLAAEEAGDRRGPCRPAGEAELGVRCS